MGSEVELAEAWGHTYVASGLAYAGYANATDFLTISGSATKVIRINQVVFRIGSTSGLLYRLYFIKRITANSGGTATAQTAVKLDSRNPAATAVVNLYSVIPASLGTSAGTIGVASVVTTVLTAAPAAFALSNFLSPPSAVTLTEPVILNGVNEFLAINGNAVSLPSGGDVQWEISWTESPR